MGGFLDGLGDVDAVPLFSAGAWRAAPPDATTTAELQRRLETSLARAPDVDGVLVNLHGAMVAHGAIDMEADTLGRIRARFPTIPVMAVLDLHANFSAEACTWCDAVLGYRTYPHVDMADCGRELASLMLRALGGERFVTAYTKIGRLTTPLAQDTNKDPMRGLLHRAEATGLRANVERVTLLPGFPYSDVARCGFTILAVATRDRAGAALEVVRRTRADVERHLDEFTMKRPDAASAVHDALQRTDHPVVLADLADNVGGGSPGDGTVILSELVAQHAKSAIVIIADAEVVASAQLAGTGSEREFIVGGKSDRLHGNPVKISARFARLGDGEYRAGGSWMTDQTFSMGPTATLELESGTIVLVTSRATPPFHIEQLTSTGIAPSAASIIVAKGAVAWRAAYEQVMASAIEVDTPGCCPLDPMSLTREFSPLDVSPTLPADRNQQVVIGRCRSATTTKTDV